MSPWPAVLDELERTLAAQREALARGDHDAVVAFTAPADLGPLPPVLLPRAQALLAAAQQLSTQLSAQVEAAARELAYLQRVRPRESSPSYVDAAL